MQKQGESKVWYSLYGRLLDRRVLYRAFLKVKAAKGAPGNDGQTINAFMEKVSENVIQLEKELKEKSYRPQPVRRVEIPKPKGGVRLLGIPAVRDRVVQQALLEILTPIYDPHFHPSSYGYRPGRGCHDAIAKASLFMRKYELKWVVDMDLSKCFDRLQHDFLIKRLRKRVVDGSILNLIELFLASGVMVGTTLEETNEGSPQGGVISPLLANVYLDYFDQWTMKRGYRIVRYADDILIFASSRKGAERRLRAATDVLENEMGLTVNREKTCITSVKQGVRYLGVVMYSHYTTIQEEKVKAFKEKAKGLTKRNSGKSLAEIIKSLNPVIRGFANYFRVANCTSLLRSLMSWIRRRLRAIQLKLWKKPSRLHRRLRQLGYTGDFKKIKMSSWKNARSPLSSLAIPNKYLYELGLFDMGSVITGQTVHC